jgi:DNA repair photolyase
MQRHKMNTISARKRDSRNDHQTAFGSPPGFHDWETKKVDANVSLGCSNGCRYCHARAAAKRYGRIDHFDEWITTLQLRKGNVLTKAWKNHGTVRFPTTHDITPENLLQCITVIRNLLAGGNHVIVCSKPQLDCVKRLCREFADDRTHIQFRFTIGAMDDDILSFWEPGAPRFKERFDSLKLALRKGFYVSVNIEPMLDVPNVLKLFRRLAPYVNVFINIGIMCNVRRNVQPQAQKEEAEVRRIEENQAEDRIVAIYEDLKGETLVRWSPKIRAILGIRRPKRCG